MNGINLLDFSLKSIEMKEDEELFSKLTGFRIKNGADMTVTVNGVEHVQINNEDYSLHDLKNYCTIE